MQQFVLIVLRSRTQAFNLKKELSQCNIPCEIISTPKEIAVGCGFSVKIDICYCEKAKQICGVIAEQSLVGFYKIAFDGYKNTIISLL